MKDFKTIAIFSYPAEHAVLRLLFDNAEIRHIFLNETMVSIVPIYSNAIGGIKLQVHIDDIDEAVEIIRNLNRPSNLKIV